MRMFRFGSEAETQKNRADCLTAPLNFPDKSSLYRNLQPKSFKTTADLKKNKKNASFSCFIGSAALPNREKC